MMLPHDTYTEGESAVFLPYAQPGDIRSFIRPLCALSDLFLQYRYPVDVGVQYAVGSASTALYNYLVKQRWLDLPVKVVDRVPKAGLASSEWFHPVRVLRPGRPHIDRVAKITPQGATLYIRFLDEFPWSHGEEFVCNMVADSVQYCLGTCPDQVKHIHYHECYEKLQGADECLFSVSFAWGHFFLDEEHYRRWLYAATTSYLINPRYFEIALTSESVVIKVRPDLSDEISDRLRIPRSRLTLAHDSIHVSYDDIRQVSGVHYP